MADRTSGSPAGHRFAAAPLALGLALVVLAGGSGAAQAADGFKYWNYFHVENGDYTFATTGPADYTPKDGTVEAYRYGLSSAAEGLKPRTGATTYTVDDICADQQAGTGQKRVGVLLDYGTAADAPKGSTPPEPRAACAVVPQTANGQQVLDAVADLRIEKQIVCGIDGYPVTTCSVTVRNAAAAAAEENVDFAMPATTDDTSGSGQGSEQGSEQGSGQAAADDGGVSWPLVGVAVAVVALGAGALALSRRNRNA